MRILTFLILFCVSFNLFGNEKDRDVVAKVKEMVRKTSLDYRRGVDPLEKNFTAIVYWDDDNINAVVNLIELTPYNENVHFVVWEVPVKRNVDEESGEVFLSIDASKTFVKGHCRDGVSIYDEAICRK